MNRPLLKIILAVLLHVSGSCMTLFAQTISSEGRIEYKGDHLYPGHRLVGIKGDDITFNQLFRTILYQTGMTAFYNDEQLNSYLIVPNCNFDRVPLDKVLQTVLSGMGMCWCYRKDVFVIAYCRPDDPVYDLKYLDPRLVVTGRVQTEDGHALENVAVRIKGSHRGVTSDRDGKFQLEDVDPNDQLFISGLGFEPQTVKAQNDLGTISLKYAISSLSEVQVIANGLGINSVTASVSTVTESAIEEQPVSNLLSILQGRVPGLYITQTTGLPGGGYRIRLRGRNSIDNANDPLIVVDGVPFPSVPLNADFGYGTGSGIGQGANLAASPLNLLPVSDIAKIEILKDADATASYGARGANGVILITSKAPKTGPLRAAATVYTGFGKSARYVPYLNTQQYLAMRHEAFRNDGLSPSFMDPDLNRWSAQDYTNWQKKMIGGTAALTDAVMEVSGGNVSSRFRLSGNYRRETTAYPSDQYRYHKAGARLQYNYGSGDQRWHASLSAAYTTDNNRLPSTDLTSFSTMPPNTPEPYKNDSLNFDEGYFDNPYAYLLRTYDAESRNLRATGVASFEPVKGLVFRTGVGYTKMTVEEMQLNPKRSFAPTSGIETGYGYFSQSRYTNWIFEPQVRWIKEAGHSRFKIFAGLTLQEDRGQKAGFFAANYPDDQRLRDTTAAGSVSPTGKTRENYGYRGLFVRLSYSYDSRYFIDLTARRDGSTRLDPQASRWANFGTIGLGWAFARERWLKQSKVFSQGKLRVSYGTTGNDQLVSDPATRGAVIPWPLASPSGPIHGIPPQAPVCDWERITKLDIGLELGFIRDRIILTLDHYRNRTKNPVLRYQLPSVSEPRIKRINYPAIVENNGWELNLTTVNIKRKRFKWTTSFNLSVPCNRLTAFPKLEQTTYAYYYNVGLPLDAVVGVHVLGVDLKSGIYRFEDRNKDGRIDQADYTFGKALGPTLYGGLHNSITWGAFNIDFLLRFVRQDNYNYQYAFTYLPPGAMSNQPTTVLERWQSEGQNTALQRFTSSPITEAGQAHGRAMFSDRQLADASYIRLQSFLVSYCPPSGWLKTKACKLFLQGQNLFTITSFPGRDPESASPADVYPPLRFVTGGFQIGF